MEEFEEACRAGDLETVQGMVASGAVDVISDGVVDAMLVAAGEGRPGATVVKWLSQVEGVDIHARHDAVFLMAVINNDMDLAQWIWTTHGNVRLEDDDIPDKMDLYFSEYLAMAKWFREVVANNAVDIHFNDDAAMRGASRFRKLDVVAWLSSLDQPH